jgi:hypothetical protein
MSRAARINKRLTDIQFVEARERLPAAHQRCHHPPGQEHGGYRRRYGDGIIPDGPRSDLKSESAICNFKFQIFILSDTPALVIEWTSLSSARARCLDLQLLVHHRKFCERSMPDLRPPHADRLSVFRATCRASS